MASTISFTPINDGAFYTIEQLNELFRDAAAVINAKLDVAIRQERQGVLVGEARVMRSSDAVTLTDHTSAQVRGTFSTNYKRLRNLRAGTSAGDAITVAQAREIVAG